MKIILYVIFVLYVLSALRRASLHVHRTPRAVLNLGSSHLLCCMFTKLRLVFVSSDAGGREGELGSVLLSVRTRLSAVH